MGGATHRPYPPEFGAEAVRLAREPGATLTGVVRDLGISLHSLRHWITQAEVDEGYREGLTTDEREEHARLRTRNRVIRTANPMIGLRHAPVR